MPLESNPILLILNKVLTSLNEYIAMNQSKLVSDRKINRYLPIKLISSEVYKFVGINHDDVFEKLKDTKQAHLFLPTINPNQLISIKSLEAATNLQALYSYIIDVMNRMDVGWLERSKLRDRLLSICKEAKLWNDAIDFAKDTHAKMMVKSLPTPMPAKATIKTDSKIPIPIIPNFYIDILFHLAKFLDASDLARLSAVSLWFYSAICEHPTVWKWHINEELINSLDLKANTEQRNYKTLFFQQIQSDCYILIKGKFDKATYEKNKEECLLSYLNQINEVHFHVARNIVAVHDVETSLNINYGYYEDIKFYIGLRLTYDEVLKKVSEADKSRESIQELLEPYSKAGKFFIKQISNLLPYVTSIWEAADCYDQDKGSKFQYKNGGNDLIQVCKRIMRTKYQDNQLIKSNINDHSNSIAYIKYSGEDWSEVSLIDKAPPLNPDHLLKSTKR